MRNLVMPCAPLGYFPPPQTDDICADFEKRLKAIVPSLNTGGGASAGGAGGGGRGMPFAGSALAACAVAQAQSGSLILAATGTHHLRDAHACMHACIMPTLLTQDDGALCAFVQARRSRVGSAATRRSFCGNI
jgi:hypothetical protein